VFSESCCAALRMLKPSNGFEVGVKFCGIPEAFSLRAGSVGKAAKAWGVAGKLHGVMYARGFVVEEKNNLFFITGPPLLPPNWFPAQRRLPKPGFIGEEGPWRRACRCGKTRTPSRETGFVPVLLVMFTTPPVAPPYSAEKELLLTFTSEWRPRSRRRSAKFPLRRPGQSARS